MSYYKYPTAPSYIAIFSCNVDEVYNEKEALKKIRKIEIRCEAFAKALDIHFHSDFFFYFDDDNTSSKMFIFNIKEPKDSIFLKMPCLLNFAACINLTFINQDQLPEKLSHTS